MDQESNAEGGPRASIYNDGGNPLNLNLPNEAERSIQTPGRSSARGGITSKDASPKDQTTRYKKSRNVASKTADYTTVYLPNGQSFQKTPLNKKDLQKFNVEHWKKFEAPVYDTVLTLEKFHMVKDKNTANFYFAENKPKNTLDKIERHIRNFSKQNKRKEIDTFHNLTESRFEPINKTPNNLSNFKKAPCLNFKGYMGRRSIWPERDQSTFYDTNKEFTMKKLASNNVPWGKMTSKSVCKPVDTEMPEHSYDPIKALEVATYGLKPKAINLTNIGKQKARDDIMLKTNDAFANVLLENTKQEREIEIQARREQHRRYLNLDML